MIGLHSTLAKQQRLDKVAGRVLRVHHSTICLISRPGNEAFFCPKSASYKHKTCVLRLKPSLTAMGI